MQEVKDQWQLRFEHYRDTQVAQCKSQNIEVPKTEYGALKNIIGLWRKFHAVSFWEEFNKLGHDSTIFENCKCYKVKKC